MSILHLSKSRGLLKEKVIKLAEQMFGAGDICRHFWGALDLSFLYPNALVADACYKFVKKYEKGERIDYRLTDTDLVHLGYALAYKVDYFLTTDTKLKHYVPEKSNLRVIDHETAKEIF
jgi:hypothetical protein